VPLAELACGRVGDDGNGMVAQLVRPALRLLSRSAACMAASWCIFMEWRIVPLCVSVVVLASWACAVCHGPRTSRSWGEVERGGDLSSEARLVERGGDFSCEAETCRARQRLVVGIPLVGNWSEVQPIGWRLDVLLVWVLTGVLVTPQVFN
jgi:hypothetical protein